MNLILPDGFSFGEIYGAVKGKDKINYLLFHLWNSHESISNGDLGIITNPLEIINLKLKSKIAMSISLPI